MINSLIKRRASSAASSLPATKMGKFESEMWNTYQKVAPHAQKIHKLFEQQGESIINDHVAFRTYNHNKININVFEDNLHKHYNYKPIHQYQIPDKNLFAKLFFFFFFCDLFESY